MRHLILTLSVIFLSISSSFAQTKVGEATLPNTVTVGEHNLELNGAGIREKLWFDLYACGLYVGKKGASAKEIVDADSPMLIKLEILSSLVSKKKLVEAFKDGIDESNEISDVNRLNKKIELFLQFIKGDIVKGDVFDIAYSPNTGLKLLKAGKELGKIEGLDFKKLVFNIWLSKTSVDDDLKNKLVKK